MSFRASARAKARQLKVLGWVRNLPCGDVEAIAEGDVNGVEAFVRWCNQGPSGAAVESVTLTDEPAATGQFKSFEVID